ncbi:oligopeptide transport system permease protein [Maritalea mobilis]|uniref:Oligopeptide transport system permease protein n=1 Tax=Maritalea mobilis TaxID=483324 RepID=A0A4R6VV26_9HYPH|nr:ABC transporter permease [Maritalea mobilis]TDQ64071.1 oligopeptide transport system permease protein [Maritalea mobilis]
MDQHKMTIPADKWAPIDRGAQDAEFIAAPSLTYWQDVRQRLWRNRPAMASLAFIIFLILAAIFGPMMTHHTYYDQDLKLSNIPPIFEVYQTSPEDGEPQYVFLNSGNFKLYEVNEGGEILGLLRAKRKDLMKKQHIYAFGEEELRVDYSQLPATLVDGDGNPATSLGLKWNQTNWFGTDSLGRDVLVRQLYGARISLTVAFVAALVNFFIGVFYGGVAGYFGGNVDNVMMRIVEIISTIPLTLYVILMMVVFQSGFLSIIIAIGSVFWVDMARIVRGQMLSLKNQDYVAAAKTMGASTKRILTRHLLPNTMGPILVTLTLLIPSAIFIESFMSFIGLGVSVPMASWGTLTAEAVETLRAYPHQLFFPAAAISLTMFAFNFLGDGLRDALDPRLRK